MEFMIGRYVKKTAGAIELYSKAFGGESIGYAPEKNGFSF